MSKRRSGGCGGGNVLCSVTGSLVDETKAVLRSSVRVPLPRKNQSKWVAVSALRALGATQSTGLVFGDSHGACTTLGDSLDRPGDQSITIGDTMPKIRPVKDTSPRSIRVARPGEPWDAGQRPPKVVMPSGRCIPLSQWRRVLRSLLRGRSRPPLIHRASGQVGPILEISGRRGSELK